jgi:hypothetical protein
LNLQVFFGSGQALSKAQIIESSVDQSSSSQ